MNSNIQTFINELDKEADPVARAASAITDLIAYRKGRLDETEDFKLAAVEVASTDADVKKKVLDKVAEKNAALSADMAEAKG